MKYGYLIDRKKCSLNSDCKHIDALLKLTDVKCIDSPSEHLFRTCSVATSLLTSTILLLLCRAAVLW